MMTTQPHKVALCGAPRSGNKLIREMLKLHGFVAEVRHYGTEKDFRIGGGPSRAVWPVRVAEFWMASCIRDYALLPKPQGWHAVARDLHGNADAMRVEMDNLWLAHCDSTIGYLMRHFAPVFIVSYEDIVQQPDLIGCEILGHCANPMPAPDWKGWGTEIFDGNAKWKEAADGQEEGNEGR